MVGLHGSRQCQSIVHVKAFWAAEYSTARDDAPLSWLSWEPNSAKEPQRDQMFECRDKLIPMVVERTPEERGFRPKPPYSQPRPGRKMSRDTSLSFPSPVVGNCRAGCKRDRTDCIIPDDFLLQSGVDVILRDGRIVLLVLFSLVRREALAFNHGLSSLNPTPVQHANVSCRRGWFSTWLVQRGRQIVGGHCVPSPT
ncbi:hypothetical protein BC827DRAFT_120941 [Russula dissimulans]|jgi:hypothetical protein|nr:hypothetical protein BC827DRAFT_120941 [Russula dissimulans]